MNKRYIIIILLLISRTIVAQDILNNYLEIAAENNPAIKASFNEYMAALEVIPQVGSLPDPQLAFGYFIQAVETRVGPQQGKASITQMFPWFGTIGAKKNVAIQTAKAKYETFEETKSNLFFEVQSAYYDLYFIMRAVKITSKNIQILQSFKNLALIKSEAGTASGVDELRAEMELADTENKLLLLKDNWYVHEVKFNKLLNVSSENPIDIPETLWNIDLIYSKNTMLDSLRLNNHQVLSLDYLLESYHNKVVAAKKSGKPNISIGIDYISVGKTDNAMVDPNINGQDAILFPKISISIPLYRKKYTAMVKEAVFLQQASDNKKTDKINTLEFVFEKAYSEYSDANRKINLYNNQLNLAKQAIKILESEYATNGKDFEEILRMERMWLMYSLQLEKSRSDKQASIAFINYLIGN